MRLKNPTLQSDYSKYNLEPEKLGEKMVTVVSQSQLASKLGFKAEQMTTSTLVPIGSDEAVFKTSEEQKVAQIAYEVIRRMENEPQRLPSVSYLNKAEGTNRRY